MNSSYYKNQMTKYNNDINYINNILEKLNEEKKETEKLMKEIKDSGIIGKLGSVLSDIEDTSSKLEQSSRYMSHIIISKSRTFDRGELASVAQKMNEKAEGINALSQEIQNKLNELEESLESTNESIDYHNDLLVTAVNNYNKAEKNYKDALKREALQSSSIENATSTSPSTTFTRTTIHASNEKIASKVKPRVQADRLTDKTNKKYLLK